MATAPVSPTQLINASLDADDLGVFVNGGVNDTAINRAGTLLRTLTYYQNQFDLALAGAGYETAVPYTAGIAIVRPRQTVEYEGAVYAPIPSEVPFTTSGTFETAKFQLVQGVTAAALGSSSGASLVGTAPGQTLGDIIAKWHFVTDYNGIDRVLDATSGPVMIHLAPGRYAPPTKSKLRSFVGLVGTAPGAISTDGFLLEGGTVLEGSFLSPADMQNGTVYNIGIDRGKTVNESLFEGVKGDGLVISGYPGTGTTGNTLRGWRIDNVVALVEKNTAEDPTLFHGVLLEGLDKSCIVGSITGYGGIASAVVKCTGLRGRFIRGVGGTPYTVVFKSNTYAPFTDVHFDTVESDGDGGTGRFDIVSDDPAPVGAALSRLSIATLTLLNQQSGFMISSASGRPVSDVHIGFISGKTISGIGMSITGANTSRITIDTHDFEGVGIGVYVGADVPTGTVHIGSGRVRSATGHGYQIDANGVTAGRIHASYCAGFGILCNSAEFQPIDVAGSDNGSGGAGPLIGGDYMPLTTNAGPVVAVAPAEGLTAIAYPFMSISDKYIRSFTQGVVQGSFNGMGNLVCTVPLSFRPFSNKSDTCVVNRPKPEAPEENEFVAGTYAVLAENGNVLYFGPACTQVYLSGKSYDVR